MKNLMIKYNHDKKNWEVIKYQKLIRGKTEVLGSNVLVEFSIRELAEAYVNDLPRAEGFKKV